MGHAARSASAQVGCRTAVTQMKGASAVRRMPPPWFLPGPGEHGCERRRRQAVRRSGIGRETVHHGS
jgi:hypothetical protein